MTALKCSIPESKTFAWMANIMLSVICAHVASRYRLENQVWNSTAVSESISNEAAAMAGNPLAAAIAERAQARKLSSDCAPEKNAVPCPVLSSGGVTQLKIGCNPFEPGVTR